MSGSDTAGFYQPLPKHTEQHIRARLEDDKRRARVTVARNSLDPEDCDELLGMLGIIPGQDGGL